MRQLTTLATPAFVVALLLPAAAGAQGSAADYERANGLRAKYEALAVNVPGPATWIDKTPRFWYRRSVKGGHEFVIVDAATQAKTPAFDHDRLAQQLSKVIGKPYTGITLPFGMFAFADNETSITMTIDGGRWKCRLRGLRLLQERRAAPARRTIPARACRPDGKWEALINNYNIAIRAVGAKTIEFLSTDGSEGNAYTLASIRLVARFEADRRVSRQARLSPRGALRRVVAGRSAAAEVRRRCAYAKPGDVLDLDQPVDLRRRTRRPRSSLDNALFPNAVQLSRLVWRKDGRALTFEYNQRGHQVYRVIEVDAATGKTRAVITEEPKTFFDYRTANGELADSGKKYRFDVDDGREIDLDVGARRLESPVPATTARPAR